MSQKNAPNERSSSLCGSIGVQLPGPHRGQLGGPPRSGKPANSRPEMFDGSPCRISSSGFRRWRRSINIGHPHVRSVTFYSGKPHILSMEESVLYREFFLDLGERFDFFSPPPTSADLFRFRFLRRRRSRSESERLKEQEDSEFRERSTTVEISNLRGGQDFLRC